VAVGHENVASSLDGTRLDDAREVDDPVRTVRVNAPPVAASQATASQYMSRYDSLAERIRDRSRPMALASESSRYREKRSSSSRNADLTASVVATSKTSCVRRMRHSHQEPLP